MENTNTEPRLATYLHAKACRMGTPLAGNFELTPRCNFNCKMCYVHLSEQEQKRRGTELSADEWLTIAENARSQGMLFLLLTGGEPLIRQDFPYILTELKKMGLMVSVNSNASLIDREMLDFLRQEPPFRFNITLYGASGQAYERLCGNNAFDRVLHNIRFLKEIGISVKLNMSLTPYNVGEMESVFHIAEGLKVPMQLATYMFPPIRRDADMVGDNDRFSSEDAAKYSIAWDRLRFSPDQFQARAEGICKGVRVSEGTDCEGTPGEGTPGEGILCRAGRSAFWIDWQGTMTPCGMMTDPRVSVRQLGFARAWEETKAAAAAVRLPGECMTCRQKEACHACAAMCVSETGHFDGKPEYVCRMMKETLRLLQEERGIIP